MHSVVEAQVEVLVCVVVFLLCVIYEVGLVLGIVHVL